LYFKNNMFIFYYLSIKSILIVRTNIYFAINKQRSIYIFDQLVAAFRLTAT